MLFNCFEYLHIYFEKHCVQMWSVRLFMCVDTNFDGVFFQNNVNSQGCNGYCLHCILQVEVGYPIASIK